MPSLTDKVHSPDAGETKFISREAAVELHVEDTKSDGSRPRSKRDKRRSPAKAKTPIPSHGSLSAEGRRSKVRERRADDLDENDEEAKDEDLKHLSPMQRRTRLSENYEKPVSGREIWWRSTIKETPAPGAYESDGFAGQLRRVTYGFKSDGRRTDPQPYIGRGRYLLPGAYEHDDFQKRVAKFSSTYGFKNTSREDRDMMMFGRKDKDVNVSPNAYSVEKYMTIQADKAPSKLGIFKSGTVRFPTNQFKPKEGPGPGCYDNTSPTVLHPVSSSFKSKTPRFTTSHTKVPGPGTYVSTVQSPLPATVANMGRLHGIFFSSAFQA